MPRYEFPRECSSIDSSTLIRRSNPFRSGDELSKSIPKTLPKSLPKSIYIKKVGNQVINIHNTTIRVEPLGITLSKHSLNSNKKLILSRKRDPRNKHCLQLHDFQDNFKIMALQRCSKLENKGRVLSNVCRSKTLESGSVKKYHSRNYKTLDVEHSTADDDMGLANRTIEVKTVLSKQQLDTIDLSTPSLIPCSVDWSSVKVPLTPQRTLKKFNRYLTSFEMKEVFQFPEVFFIGHESHKIQAESSSFDNQEGEYRLVMKDHIGYRYEVLELIGAGAFGQCVKVLDHKTGAVLAVKLIRNKPNFSKQGLVELNILKFIDQNDPNGKSNIVKVLDSLTFRRHLCIVTQLLDISLYEFLKMNNFQGFNLELIRKFAVQILQGLFFLKNHNIAHCDLKPENILLKKLGKSGVKVIDFGTSCFLHQKYFTYIQSRFYRAPEIVLGFPYDIPIDMWSFGCIIAEMYTGSPLFPGESEQEHVRLMFQILGAPPLQFLKKCPKAREYFDDKGHLHQHYIRVTRNCARNVEKLEDIFKGQKPLLDILRKCLSWDPLERLNPRDGLLDSFVIEGLPEKVRREHVKQMSSHSPYGLL